jgi:hypothetical protein
MRVHDKNGFALSPNATAASNTINTDGALMLLAIVSSTLNVI